MEERLTRMGQYIGEQFGEELINIGATYASEFYESGCRMEYGYKIREEFRYQTRKDTRKLILSTVERIGEMLARMETEARDNQLDRFDANLISNVEEAYDFMKIYIKQGFDQWFKAEIGNIRKSDTLDRLKEAYEWFITGVARKLTVYMNETDDE